jgi:hypothetical protein
VGTRDAKTELKTPAVKRRAADVADLPTGPAKAVKRRTPDVADLPTGPAKAVKRKAAAKPFRDVVKWVNRLQVARRAGLTNSHGSSESGWVVRDEDKKALFHVVPSEETLLEALGRMVGQKRDVYFDVMQDGASRACLVLHDTDNQVTGSGELLDEAAEEIASIHVGRKLAAQCTVGGNPTPLVKLKPVRHAVHAMGEGKLLATIDTVATGTLIPKIDHYAVAFQNGPRGDQRLMVVAAIIVADAWTLRDFTREKRGRRVGEAVLYDLLGPFDTD